MSAHSIRGTTALLGLSLLLGSVAWYGCNDGQTSPDPRQNLAGVSLAADPVADALSGSDGQVSQEEVRRVDRLTEILGLAADPSRTLLGRYAEFRGGLGELAGRLRAGEVDRSAARERAGHLRRGFEAELQIVLTEPQYDHLQQLRQLHHRQRHAHRDPAERWAEWLRAVGAGSQQQESILDALHSLRDGIQALRQQLRDERIDRSEAFAGAALLRAEFDARLRQLLTPEQFALLLVLRPDGVGGRP